MAEKSNQVTRELQRRINLLVRETLKDIRTEALEEFDRNFEREAFFNDKWARRKFNDDESRGLLVRTGALRRSITARVTERKSVLFESTQPYAAIHNEGGTITVTAKMKRYFWYRFRVLTGGKASDGSYTKLQRRKDGQPRRNKKNRQLSAEAEFCRAMALKKVGSRIVIPQRRFVGSHPMLTALLKEIANEHIRKTFNQ